MITLPTQKRCSYCMETGRPSHCGMCNARDTIDNLESQLSKALERGAEAWKWAMFLRQFANLTLVRERDEARGKLESLT